MLKNMSRRDGLGGLTSILMVGATLLEDNFVLSNHIQSYHVTGCMNYFGLRASDNLFFKNVYGKKKNHTKHFDF